MMLFKRACKRGQSWDYKTQNEAFTLACLKIERGVSLKVILEQNSNRCHEQIDKSNFNKYKIVKNTSSIKQNN